MDLSSSDTSFITKSRLNLIYSVLKDLNVDHKEVRIEPLGAAGDNFIADVRVLEVKDEDEKNNVRIIMKLGNPGNGKMSGLTAVFFNNEITMYTYVLPAMSELQEKAGVALKNAYQFATCFGYSNEIQQEIILLEDLSKHGYTMLDKYKPLSNETMKLVLNSLADYHSMSYVLKDKTPDKFKEYAKRLIDMNDVMSQSDMIGNNMLGESFSQIFDKEKYKKLVKHLFTMECVEKTKKLKETDTESKYSVIVHGDMWTNNILFRVDGDKTTDCIFIDYQLARESMPVLDILYLMFICTDYEGRASHYNEWLDHYHAQLEKSLYNFGLRVNDVYPRDKLDSDMMRYAKQVLTMSIMTLSIVLRKNEESADFKEALKDQQELEDIMGAMQLTTLHMESVAKVKERIEGLIDSCFEFGLVNAV